MFKSLVRRAFRQIGFDVRRYQPARSEAAQLMALLTVHRVNLVFDVGANVGQFGQTLRDIGYRKRIVSFEPLSSAHKQLLKVSQNDKLWEVAPRAALGTEEGEVEIHVAGNSASSSVLDMLDAHASAAPEACYIGSERVPMRRLDSLATAYLEPNVESFLKIDTQGYEDRVLMGATELLKQVRGLQLELSFVPLYEGQRLFDEMVEQIKTNGFELWAIWPGLTDPTSGRLLQVDATFFR